MESAPSLRFEHVERRFATQVGTELVALQGLDFAVPSGEFTVLLGPSGCGKSTLLRLAAGLDAPQAGRVVVRADGRDRRPSDVRTGFVFQDPQLLPWRTVAANVALPLELAGAAPNVSPTETSIPAKRAVEEMLERVGLGGLGDRMPHELSGGMKMRASLARALVGGPRLLLLDEPFGALDELTRARLDDELRALARRLRITVLFVTHAIHEAAYLADRVLVFSPRPARIVGDLPSPLPELRMDELRFSTSFAAYAASLHHTLVAGGA